MRRGARSSQGKRFADSRIWGRLPIQELDYQLQGMGEPGGLMRRSGLVGLAIWGLAGAAYGQHASGSGVDSSGEYHAEAGSSAVQEGMGGTRVVTDPATGSMYLVPASGEVGGVRGASRGQGESPGRSNSYVQWQDPAEGAFSVTLPRSWQISGGTARTTRIEPHYVVRAQSADGGV